MKSKGGWVLEIKESNRSKLITLAESLTCRKVNWDHEHKCKIKNKCRRIKLLESKLKTNGTVKTEERPRTQLNCKIKLKISGNQRDQKTSLDLNSFLDQSRRQLAKEKKDESSKRNFRSNFSISLIMQKNTNEFQMEN